MAGSPPGGNGGGKRSSGGSSVAAGRKAKERYDSKKSKERWKANSPFMPYSGGKKVKGSY